jgi:CRISPR/Cas system-associated exonuclease Cas4 (RecB family)
MKYAKKFSASALTTYISCPLKFYFQYVGRLKELDETEETIEGGLLGTILHEAMQSLYNGHQTISAADFGKIKLQIPVAVDAAIKLHYTDADRLEGKNILMRNVLIELVEHIIEHDKKSAPLTIKNLEQEIFFHLPVLKNKSVILYGIIDRVDNVQGALRIIDYKTGKVQDAVSSSVSELFTSPDYKEQFQAFFYSWLYHSNHKTSAIKAGLYRLKKVSEGVKYINEGEVITAEQFGEFEVQLKNLLSEIFNPEIPFSQTDDEKRCLYCSFKDICNR